MSFLIDCTSDFDATLLGGSSRYGTPVLARSWRITKCATTVFVVCYLMLAVLSTSGCKSKEPSDSKSSTEELESAAEAVASMPAAPEDPNAIRVPDGSAEELIDFLSNVAQKEPEDSATDEEKIDYVKRQMEARIAAAEKLSTMDEGTYQTIALQTKLESLRVLIAIGEQGASARFLAFAKQLADSSDPAVSRLGRIGLYQTKLDALISQGPNSPHRPAEVVSALKQLLAKESPDLSLLQAANETGLLFSQVGLAGESVEVFEAISEKFKDNADAQLAKAAETATQQANRMRLNASLQDVMRGAEGAIDDLSEQLKQFDASPQVVGTLMNLAQNLEYSGNTDNAQKIYDLAASSIPKLDGEVAGQFKELLSGAKVRLGLIGQEFSVEGVSADGSPFDWKDYAGKVVLVDFWATWCRPCIAEIPNVKENYEQFHDAGFDVVGVNLDDDPDAARAFLKKQALPWTTVISSDDNARGFDDANAKKYAVSAIPFLVLVGRDGKVDSLHVRGPQLQSRLSELLAGDSAEASDIGGDAAGDSGDDEIEMIPAEEEADQPEVDSAPQTDVLDKPTETMPPDASPQTRINPYRAPDDLDEDELVLYLLELKDKAKSIQRRPGFCDAVCDVADRVLASSSSEKNKKLAATEKLRFLHERACLGDDAAQQQLLQTVADLRDKMPVAMASEIQFFELEQRSAQSELDPEALPQLIKECTEYLESQGENLDQRHLRLASNTVELINRLSANEREAQFQRVSKALLLSPVRNVSRYGDTLMVGGTATPSIGDVLAVKGTSVDGQTVDLAEMKDSVVLIDFWATWCGPCRKVHTQLGELLTAFPKTRLISINLDADEDSLDEFLTDNGPLGMILFGTDAKAAAKKFGIRSIPTIFVVDPQSRLHAVVHNTGQLSEMIASLEK